MVVQSLPILEEVVLPVRLETQEATLMLLPHVMIQRFVSVETLVAKVAGCVRLDWTQTLVACKEVQVHLLIN